MSDEEDFWHEKEYKRWKYHEMRRRAQFLRFSAVIIASICLLIAIYNTKELIENRINQALLLSAIPALSAASIAAVAAEIKDSPDDAYKLYDKIYSLGNKDIAVLTMQSDPCQIKSLITCNSIPPDKVKLLIGIASQNRQNELTLRAAEQQATASVVTIGVAVLALIVSIIAVFVPKNWN